MLEFMVMVNGTQGAFHPVGRRETPVGMARTSISVFVCDGEGQVLYHALVDCGPGVADEVLDSSRFPRRPPDALLLTHSHGDHFLDFDALVGGLARQPTGPRPALRIVAVQETISETLDAHFPYLRSAVAVEPVEPGRLFSLWKRGDCQLTATFIEVSHFHRSCVICLELTQPKLIPLKVLALFDIDDFYPADSEQFKRGSTPNNALFHEAQLVIAAANTWHDPATTGGKPTGHMSVQGGLQDLFCKWRPQQARLVHYSGYEDITDDYWKRVNRGERISPAIGPASPGEFDRALHAELIGRGYPDPHSICLGYQGELLNLSPLDRPDELFARVALNAAGELEACGSVPRLVGHENGVPHTSVIFIACQERSGEPRLLVHRRSKKKKIGGGLRDFAGGHVRYSGPIMARENWHNPRVLAELVRDTAVLEACQELRCNPAYQFTPGDFRQLGTIGDFTTGLEHLGSGNVEYSTAFMIGVPRDVEVEIHDTDEDGERRLEHEWLSLDEVLEEFKKAPDDFSDGAGRILARLDDSEEGIALRAELREKMEF